MLLAAATIALPRLAADESDDIKALRAQVDSLEQKIRVVERKQELKDEDAAAAAKAAPTASFTDKGFDLCLVRRGRLAAPWFPSAVRLPGVLG